MVIGGQIAAAERFHGIDTFAGRLADCEGGNHILFRTGFLPAANPHTAVIEQRENHITGRDVCHRARHVNMMRGDADGAHQPRALGVLQRLPCAGARRELSASHLMHQEDVDGF